MKIEREINCVILLSKEDLESILADGTCVMEVAADVCLPKIRYVVMKQDEEECEE
jgi:hypothetical protein